MSSLSALEPCDKAWGSREVPSFLPSQQAMLDHPHLSPCEENRLHSGAQLDCWGLCTSVRVRGPCGTECEHECVRQEGNLHLEGNRQTRSVQTCMWALPLCMAVVISGGCHTALSGVMQEETRM